MTIDSAPSIRAAPAPDTPDTSAGAAPARGAASRPSLLDHLAHAALARALAWFGAPAGDAPRARPLAVDATAGNGHDSLFLARCAPPGSLVLALDVQEAAVEATRRRLALEGFLHAEPPPAVATRALVLRRGHEELAAVLADLPKADRARPLACVVFNLGWLPGGAREATTRPATSLAALDAALEALAPGGCVCLHCYTGHAGGAGEAALALARVKALPPRRWRALCAEDANRAERAEYLLVAERLPVRGAARPRAER